MKFNPYDPDVLCAGKSHFHHIQQFVVVVANIVSLFIRDNNE